MYRVSVEFDILSLPVEYDGMLTLFHKELIDKYCDLINRSEFVDELIQVDNGFVFKEKSLGSFSLDLQSLSRAKEVAEELFDFISDLMLRYHGKLVSNN